MRRNNSGLVICVGGLSLVAFGLFLLAQQCGLSPQSCDIDRSITLTAYFETSIGSVLLLTGFWQTGIGRKRIVAEGAWLVIAVGTAVSTLGFVASSLLPWVAVGSAEIGMILGIVGSALLTFGLIKTKFGQRSFSENASEKTRWRWPVWTGKEWIAFTLLSAILVATATAAGVYVYQNSPATCTGCGCGGLVTPCPGKEALSMTNYNVTPPTNATLEIWSVGTASTTFIAYYVKDSAGDTYSRPDWQGPNIAPSAHALVSISIDGKAFAFQTGRTYTVIMITSRNNQFTFAIIA